MQLREGHYRTDLKTACTLAALQMQSTYGDCGWEPEWPKDAHIKHMMAPSTWKGKDSAKHVKRQIMGAAACTHPLPSPWLCP